MNVTTFPAKASSGILSLATNIAKPLRQKNLFSFWIVNLPRQLTKLHVKGLKAQKVRFFKVSVCKSLRLTITMTITGMGWLMDIECVLRFLFFL
ncbi:hypothetical protein O3W44_16540 [Pantoea sp. LMR881]|uniref:hypothetical protein n=1 Tax=Pantoea sp. LMR881 TaxID=3014336 RepID=UPI0022AFE635|nr:hypothetical protein [Pantoea sp. LMR881]MCZ4060363.1 hypothetical protein [Pantoea sp. LMR881]